jgi:hypothetical protein
MRIVEKQTKRYFLRSIYTRGELGDDPRAGSKNLDLRSGLAADLKACVTKKLIERTIQRAGQEAHPTRYVSFHGPRYGRESIAFASASPTTCSFSASHFSDRPNRVEIFPR